MWPIPPPPSSLPPVEMNYDVPMVVIFTIVISLKRFINFYFIFQPNPTPFKGTCLYLYPNEDAVQ